MRVELPSPVAKVSKSRKAAEQLDPGPGPRVRFPAMLRVDQHTELPHPGTGPVVLTPVDPPNEGVVTHRGDHKEVRAHAEQTVLAPPLPPRLRRAKPRPFERRVARIDGESIEAGQISLLKGTQPDGKLYHDH